VLLAVCREVGAAADEVAETDQQLAEQGGGVGLGAGC
jgi:hypothetical protein